MKNDEGHEGVAAERASGLGPDLKGLIGEFKRCGTAGSSRAKTNEDVRFCRWAGQTEDCKKHGSKEQPALPFEGASDSRPAMADEVVGGIVAESVAAFWRSWLSFRAGGSEAHDYAIKLADYIVNEQLAVEAWGEIPLSEHYRQMYGWVVLHPYWDLEVSLEYRRIGLMQVVGGILGLRPESVPEELRGVMEGLMVPMESGSGEGERLNADPDGIPMESGSGIEEVVGGLLALFVDPQRDQTALAMVQWLYRDYAEKAVRELGVNVKLPALSKGKVREALGNWRAGERAELPVPYICRNQPAVHALKPWQEVFLSSSVTNIRRGRPVFHVEYITEQEAQARRITREWPAKFVEEVTKQKGKAVGSGLPYETGEPSSSLGTAMSATGTTGVEWEDYRELIAVVYGCYKQNDENGVPGVYCTVFHPEVGEVFGEHGLVEGAGGQLPYVAGQREFCDRPVTSSRAVPEMIRTWQRGVKTQIDGIIDLTSVGVFPPVLVPAMAMGTTFRFGPGVQNPYKPGLKPEMMTIPTGGAPVAEWVLNWIEKRIDRSTGRLNADLPAEESYARKQENTSSFLVMWTEAIQVMLDLCQARMSDSEFARITGAPPGWLENRRGQVNVLSAKLQFDVRELNVEYVTGLMKAVNEAVIPQDVMGVTDREKWTRAQWRMINPRLARELVQEGPAASQRMFREVQLAIALMWQGNEPEYVELDPAAATKLKWTEQIVRANPMYAMALAPTPTPTPRSGGDGSLTQSSQSSQSMIPRESGSGMESGAVPMKSGEQARFAELMRKWMANLQFSMQQGQNRQVGRIGVQPGPGPQGQRSQPDAGATSVPTESGGMMAGGQGGMM